jgi:sulfur carrier protein
MDVTVDVVGGETHVVDFETGTYEDLLSEVGLSAQEAAVMVEDRPVPDDQPVDTDRVRVLRLIKGG